MSPEARELLVRAQKAKSLYSLKKITREQAKAEIDPYIQSFNEKSKTIAKKYNQKPKTISFTTFTR